MTPCVIWTGATNNAGYGHVHRRGRARGADTNAHVAAWEDAHGPLPLGKELDHLCRRKLCVNLEHLELVTHRENVLRGTSPAALNARKTRCVNGHSLADAYRRPNGDRRCRGCVQVWNRRRSRQ